jgi:hypothetical protein
VRLSPSTLFAYDANNLGRQLYNTGQVPGRDALGTAIKFSVPTVTDGHVYVGTADSLVVYGLLGGEQPGRVARGSRSWFGEVARWLEDSSRAGSRFGVATQGPSATRVTGRATPGVVVEEANRSPTESGQGAEVPVRHRRAGSGANSLLEATDQVFQLPDSFEMPW